MKKSFPVFFVAATDLSAHELGHNWNAPHFTCANSFHPSLTQPIIEAFRSSRTCLNN